MPRPSYEDRGGGPIQTRLIVVADGRERIEGIRQELFGFSEILEVFVTSRADALVVVCAGRPRPAEWLRALRVLGYQAMSHPGPSARAAQVAVVAA